MLGPERFLPRWPTDTELQDDDTPDIDLTAEWTRPPRIPTDQERQVYEAGLKRHVERLQAIDPFRPVLEPHARVQEQQMPAAPPPPAARPTFKPAKGPPEEPGMYLCRQFTWQRWTVVKVIADVNGKLWLGWEGERSPAQPIDVQLEWLAPGLEVPR